MNVRRYILLLVVLLAAVLPCFASESQIERETIRFEQGMDDTIQDMSDSLDIFISKTKTRTQLKNKPQYDIVWHPYYKSEYASCRFIIPKLYSLNIDKCNLFCAYLE